MGGFLPKICSKEADKWQATDRITAITGHAGESRHLEQPKGASLLLWSRRGTRVVEVIRPIAPIPSYRSARGNNSLKITPYFI